MRRERDMVGNESLQRSGVAIVVGEVGFEMVVKLRALHRGTILAAWQL